VGWTPDGKKVLFASGHASKSAYPRLFEVRADGLGPAQVLPLPSADAGSYSPDGTTLAYVPVEQWQSAWKHYRGGQTTPIWLVDMRTLEIEKIPRDGSNDSYPVWANGNVYFLSDRNGAVSLFSYDTQSKQVQPVLDNKGLDFKTLSAGPGALVLEQFGSLHLYDMATHQEHAVAVNIRGDLPQLAPHLDQIAPAAIENIAFSASGARVVVEARGDIFTLPAEKGDIRNLTKTPGAAERDPAWSPDGKSVAYFSDASGEYQLFIRDQDGLTAPKVIDLGPDASFFYTLVWSPDSKRIAYTDKHLRIWYVDVAGGRPVKIDAGLRGGFGARTELSWSPDSQWIAYTRDLESEIHAVFVYSLATHTATQLTDGMSNAAHPAFDPSGGGLIADYVVNVLGQKHLSNAIERDGKPVRDPQGAMFGPKAMLINQSAGSGGDAMPWYFRKAGLGTLVGMRTWGGLVGIGGYPTLIDGGRVTAPRYAIYGLNGDWEVEGHGVAPDVEVEDLPKDAAAGHDAQLERAVAIVMQQIKEHPVPISPVPAYPNYHKSDALGVGP
jgi:Tol biopolymer transport system component